MKTKEQLEEELHKPYLDVSPFYFINRMRVQKMIEREFGYTPKPEEPEPPKKDPRWFVVHDGYDSYVSEFHTKKEALEEMKGGLSHCFLIKGKIVK
jgi:hypothetical protein